MTNIILDKVQIKRGLRANLPVLDPGEPALCTDSGEEQLAIGTATGNIFIPIQSITDMLTEITDARGNYSTLLEKLNSMVLSGGSGSGVLVYQTLADLQSAYPNGINQPAWIVADNAWYYWNSGTVTPPADTTAPTLTITAGGTFTGTKTVTMSANETADIYYTLDGSTPTTASSVYSSALSITATTTLKAFAKDTAGNSSAVQTVTYTLDAGAPADTTAPIVTASPAAGTYTSAQSVTLAANETATIYYTTNGTTPTTASTVYTGPISVSATTTLQFIAKDTAGNTSTPVAATYTISVATNYLKINYNLPTVETVRTPSMTFNKVILDITPYYSSGWAYVIDPRNDTGTVNGNMYVTSAAGAFSKSANVASVAINGNSAATSVTVGQRQTIEINYTTDITNVATIGGYQNVSSGYTKDVMKADVYNVKFYNGATLLAHYDMTKGNVNDQSGNGNNAVIRQSAAINNNTQTTVTGNWG